MIRKTIAKAFGRSLKQNVESSIRPQSTVSTRVGKIQLIFKDLHEAFRRALEKRLLAGQEDLSVRLSDISPQLEGQEFMVELGGCTVRFCNGMNGVIWMHRQQSDQHEPSPRLSILSLHLDDLGALSLIEKPVQSGRTAFRFTSVPRIVDSMLRELAPLPDKRRSEEEAVGSSAGMNVEEATLAEKGVGAPEKEGARAAEGGNE